MPNGSGNPVMFQHDVRRTAFGCARTSRREPAQESGNTAGVRRQRSTASVRDPTFRRMAWPLLVGGKALESQPAIGGGLQEFLTAFIDDAAVLGDEIEAFYMA